GYVFEMGDNFTIQNPFLIKLDSDGNLIWGTNAIRYSPFNGQSIVINGDDVYLGLGMLHNTWNDVEITSPVNQGLIPDIQIMRFDAQTGEAQEVIDGNVTTPSQDAIMAMAMDYNGDLVVGGYFGSDLFYDTDLHIHNNAVDSDFFIAKYHTGEEMGVKNQNLQTVKIYPNPTTGVLNLQSKTNLESYQLYDLQGRIVKQGKLIDKQIDLSGVDNGLYFLRVRDQTGNVENLKVVKK
ncbi:MAG TPA: T9SS type A sorting domain-containing protein, partial [Flavobacteriaceae bacterium]|nr:T9SS type A sorting domain-containing protein [Flavobacteriaceae bacterium]